MVVEEHGLAHRLGELGDLPPDDISELSALERGDVATARVVGELHRGAAAEILDATAGGVAGDVEEPRPEALRGPQVRQVFKSLEERLLDDVVHPGARDPERPGDGMRLLLVAQHQLLERLGPVLEDLPHQGGVGVRHEEVPAVHCHLLSPS